MCPSRTSQVDASDQRIGQRIGQEYLGAAPRVAAQAGVDRQLTRLDTFKVGAEVRSDTPRHVLAHLHKGPCDSGEFHAQHIFASPSP